ncbi:MAG TPA: haloacid dehalogenase type II [Solirubrobacteraceae bacterium]|nr:haloacid dehalogenase type II [Solirubrobacteraceae bacterium]
MILFDLNGTLTDPGAIGGAWGAPDLGVAVLAAAVQSAMVDAILGNSRAFSEHVEAALRDEVGRLGLEPERIDEALEAAAALPAFADTAPGLDAMAGAGLRLVVLTNSGADAARRTLEANGLAERFERILGVDAVGSFKPDPAVYRYALEELGCDAHEVTFVSAHAWDLAGAAHAGMRSAFVRRDEPWASAYPRPDIEATTLPGIATALAALAA